MREARMNTAAARRVGSVDEIERAGDYFGPTHEVDANGVRLGPRGCWFLLPIHEGCSKFDRVTRGSGLHRVSEPPWTFVEHDDGSLEIQGSILSGARDPEGAYFHGWLRAGNVWEWE